MKKNLSINSLRGLAISAVASALLNYGVLAQPNPRMVSSNETYLNKLECHMNMTQQSLKYDAPDAAGQWFEAEEALINLDFFAENLESELKYRAPVHPDNELMENAEYYAESALNDLKYKAPEKDMEPALALIEKPVMHAIQKHPPVKVEYFNTSGNHVLNASFNKSANNNGIFRKNRLSRTKSSKVQYAEK